MRFCSVLSLIGAITLTSPAFAEKPQDRMERVAAAVEERFGQEMEPTLGQLCRDPDYCEAYISNVKIKSFMRVTEALTTTLDPHETYLNACAAILQGLLSMNPTLATQYVNEAFNHAAANGSASAELSDVTMEVAPGLDDRLACRFLS